MKENITTGILLNKAGIAGIVLGLISTAYIFISMGIASITSPVLNTLLTLVVWTVKFVLCIWLMMFFMKKLARSYDGVTNSTTFKFGTAIAACSALIFAAASLANVTIINPDLISRQMETVVQILGSKADSNTLSALGEMEESMPKIIFFSNLFYCFLYGVVLSLILSRRIPSIDPFAGLEEMTPEDDSEGDSKDAAEEDSKDDSEAASEADGEEDGTAND